MRRLIVLLALLVAAGCGGGVASSTPDGYETYEAPQASFAHPHGWQVERDETDWRAVTPTDRTAVILLRVNPIDFESAFAEWRDGFEQQAESVAQAAGAKLEDHDLTVAGAAETITYRVRGEIKGKRHTTVTAYVVPDDRKSVVQLTAAGPDNVVDAEAVVRSLKLKDG